MKKTIVVCGSLAYDRIMDFPGYFSSTSCLTRFMSSTSASR